MLKRLDDADRLLDVLRRYPGLTQKALFGLHGIAPSLLYRCLELNLIWVRVHTVGHRSGHHEVWRFYAVED